jgi:PKD repeat protein
MLTVFMVSRRSRGFLVIGVLVGFAALTAACEKVPLLAPSGSTITLTTATSALGFNGTADIIAQVIEPSGTPPHSGTHVTFTTSLGTIEPAEVQTDLNGRATVRFVAGTTSGVATITAISGGAAVPAASALKIAVGSAAVGGIAANANPSTVSASGGSSTITAKVTDSGGNVLAGIPVTFTTDAGSLSSSVSNTDSTGTAATVLTTSRTAKVTATAGVATTSTGSGGTTTTTTAAATSTVTVSVNATASITIGSPSPAAPTVNQTVSFALTYPTATTGASPITRVNVDWGDGRTSSFTGAPPSIAHTFSSAGSYLVVVTGFDAFGDTANASTAVTVTPQAQPTVSITASAKDTTVSFTIAATAPTGATISSIVVDYGDGSVDTLSGNATSVQHVYAAAGTYRVTVTATDSNGGKGSASTVLVLSNPAPTAGFSVSPTSGTTATTFQFNGSDSTGAISSYAWDFGDGKSASGLTASNKYDKAGTYTVRLTVTDTAGRTATTVKTVTVS